jgi:hypothetical protein
MPRSSSAFLLVISQVLAGSPAMPLARQRQPVVHRCRHTLAISPLHLGDAISPRQRPPCPPVAGVSSLLVSMSAAIPARPSPYLFQCAELVNRYLSEQWALPYLPGSAARYLDYYQDGALHPGVIRDFPASIAQMLDDASQGVNARAPQAGDLLVIQDVQDPRRGWTSGLTSTPGQVALIHQSGGNASVCGPGELQRRAVIRGALSDARRDRVSHRESQRPAESHHPRLDPLCGVAQNALRGAAVPHAKRSWPTRLAL